MGFGKDLPGPADGLISLADMDCTRAIVRKPGKSLVNGLSTAGLGIPDYAKALLQHAEYVKALEGCGLRVQVLEADERYPDSTFLEDVALLTPHCGIVLNPGAPSRRGEIEGMDRLLSEFFHAVRRIEDPGTVEGGDILRVEDHYYIGLTSRTNQAGAEGVIAILEEFGYSGSLVQVREMLHLKTGIAYLDQGRMVAAPELLEEKAFEYCTLFEIPLDEAYAANCLCLNGRVILPAGCLGTEAMIRALGYPIQTVDLSEFRKLDGGLSCLSLRF